MSRLQSMVHHFISILVDYNTQQTNIQHNLQDILEKKEEDLLAFLQELNQKSIEVGYSKRQNLLTLLLEEIALLYPLLNNPSLPLESFGPIIVKNLTQFISTLVQLQKTDQKTQIDCIIGEKKHKLWGFVRTSYIANSSLSFSGDAIRILLDEFHLNKGGLPDRFAALWIEHADQCKIVQKKDGLIQELENKNASLEKNLATLQQEILNLKLENNKKIIGAPTFYLGLYGKSLQNNNTDQKNSTNAPS